MSYKYIYVPLLEETVTSYFHCHDYTLATVHMTIKALNLQSVCSLA